MSKYLGGVKSNNFDGNDVKIESSQLAFNDTDNSHTVALVPPITNMTANLTLSMPAADGNSGEVIVTNGSGNLSIGYPRISTFTISHNETGGTSAGDWTAPTKTYITRKLNFVNPVGSTIVFPTTPADNTITINRSGLWYADFSVPGYEIATHRAIIRIEMNGGGSQEAGGMVARSGVGTDITTCSRARMIFNLQDSDVPAKLSVLQASTKLPPVTDGLGKAFNDGVFVEVYTSGTLTKIRDPI